MTRRPGFPARIASSVTPTPARSPALAQASIATKNIAEKPALKKAKALFGSKPTPTARPAAPHSAAATPHGTGLDSGSVRARMVEKLAQQGIRDPRVLQAMNAVERHRFVDSALVNQAYEDTSLPIGLGQTISKPNVVARMIELLLGATQGGEARLGRVLEIGTGCGYQAAVLSQVAREVYSIERLRGLHDKARDNLRPFRLANLHLLFGDGMVGYAKGAPYAAIVAAAGGEQVPRAWTDQLAVGGRIVAPTVTHTGQQALVVIDKTPRGLDERVLEAVHFVPLKSGVA
jgi:protein-L-isoaspartate(D-aspartate) O-methyltransferase